MGVLVGGVIFVLVGILAAFFFEMYRDFSLKRLRAWGRRDTYLSSKVPSQPVFIWTIRSFGVLLMVIGIAMCVSSLS